MRIEIIFATNSSGTHEAAQVMQNTLTAAGHDVSLQHAKDANVAEIGSADLTILGSCTWERFEDGKRLEGQLQLHMLALAQKLQARKLPGKKFAVFALGDSSYTAFAHAADHLLDLVKGMRATLVGEALRIDGWFFNLPENRKRAADWAKSIVT
jgi:flavodoxin